MPYRRLPKTDAARLKALQTLLNNDDIYTVRNRFIDWKLLNKAQPLYDRLLTAVEQYKIDMSSQVRNAGKIDGLQRKAALYISHFLQVLFMTIERGEIKRKYLELYGLPLDSTSLPNMKSAESIIEWGKRVVEGEKVRLKEGGRPIYKPTIGMVATHCDIFREAYEKQKQLQLRTAQSLENISSIRPECDAVLLELWNAVENHFADLPPETRFAECRKFGVVYYYRRHEERIY